MANYQLNLTGEEINERLEAIGTKDDAAASDGSLFARTNELQTDLTQHSGRIQTAEEAIKKHDDKIAALQDKDSALDSRLTAAEKTVAQHTTDLTDVAKEVDDQGAAIKQLVTQVGEDESKISDNASAIAANASAIEKHTKQINTLSEEATAQGNQIAANTDKIASHVEAIDTLNDRTTALEEKTPSMWINILATKDTAVMVNGERVELPAHTNVVVKDVETFALADNTPNPKCITRFDVHYNGIFPISKWRLSQNYQPTDETTVKWYGCSSLTTIDVSCLDTSKWTNSLTHTFEGCTSLQFLDVSGWDTSKMQYLDYMFRNCTSLQSLDVSGWDTSNVSEMFATFAACTLLQALDLSKWDTRKVTNANTMFSDCFSLTDITFGEGFGKAVASLTIDLSTCGRGEGYVLTDNTYNSMLTMYDRAANGLSTMTIKFNAKHNIPDGFIAAMTAKGYTITQ